MVGFFACASCWVDLRVEVEDRFIWGDYLKLSAMRKRPDPSGRDFENSRVWAKSYVTATIFVEERTRRHGERKISREKIGVPALNEFMKGVPGALWHIRFSRGQRKISVVRVLNGGLPQRSPCVGKRQRARHSPRRMRS